METGGTGIMGKPAITPSRSAAAWRPRGHLAKAGALQNKQHGAAAEAHTQRCTLTDNVTSEAVSDQLEKHRTNSQGLASARTAISQM